jgi:hypothetical protein
MAASTLALGQAAYTLLEAVDGTDLAKAQLRGTTETLQAMSRGGLINQVEIQGDRLTSLNVTDRSAFLSFNDADVIGLPDGTPANANINILANAENSSFNLGAGNNRLNTSRDLSESEVRAFSGNDTVRIGGSANGSDVSLGAGDDDLTVSRASANFQVAMGAGDDTALFLGTLTSGESNNVINMGDGADRATFLGGVQGGAPGSTGYELQLGAGNDTAVFGGNSVSDGFLLDTGLGSDRVTLGRDTRNAALDLGWDQGGLMATGDTVVLGVGATLADSAIRSGQSQDVLNFAGTVTDTSLDLGRGNSQVDVNGIAGFGTLGTTVWDMGSGNDTLTFGELSDISLLGDGSGFISLGSGADQLNLLGSGDGGFGAIEFDLGNDGDVDTIVFGLDSSYTDFTISNFGTNDILFIGAGSYGYGYQFLNEFANEWDLQAFQSAGNVIWSQDLNATSADQSLMTLDQDFFSENDDDSWSALDEHNQPVLDQYDQPITISDPGQLTSTDNWGYSATELPMSEAPPATPAFPGEINAS